MFASKVNENHVKYSAPLVQVLFLHIVEIGLQDESVRAKLRPFLEKSGVTDTELMEKLNLAASAEMERLQKGGYQENTRVQC